MMNIIINSHRDLHEKLKCDTRFQNEVVLNRIKNYLAYYLTYYKLVNALPEEENYGDFTLHVTLSANGKTFTEQNPNELLIAVSCLEEYDGFDLEVRYYGRTGDISCDFGEAEIDFPDVLHNYDGMLEYLQTIEDPDFEYVMAASCAVDGGAKMYWINNSNTPGEDVVNPYIADATDDLFLEETGTYRFLVSFDIEKNHRQYENLKEIILKYADPDVDDLEFSKEVWEDGACVGFINLLCNCTNTGCYAQMLEEINHELRSVEGDIDFDIEGAMYSVDDFAYAYLSTDEDNEVSLVVLQKAS